MIGGDPAFCCFDFVRKWYAVKHTMAKPATSSVSPCIVNTMLDQCCVRELFDTKQCGIGAKVLQQKENLKVFYKLTSTRRSGGIKQRWQRRLLPASQYTCGDGAATKSHTAAGNRRVQTSDPCQSTETGWNGIPYAVSG